MYKVRFKSWGLNKNLTVRDATDILRNLATMETSKRPTDLVIRGLKVSQKRANHYLQRSTKARAALTKVRKLTPQNNREGMVDPAFVLNRIDPPDDLRLPEAVIHGSYQFIANGCEEIRIRDVRAPVTSASASTVNWVYQTYTVMNFLQRRDYIQAFLALNTCFDQLRTILIDPPPALFLHLYYMIICLPPEIGRRLLGYVTQMSNITLCTNHPLSLALAALHRAGIKNALKHSWIILDSHLRMLEKWFLDYEMEMLEVYSPQDDIGSDAVRWGKSYRATRSITRLGWVEFRLECEPCLTWALSLSENIEKVSAESEHTLDWPSKDWLFPLTSDN